MIVYPRPLKPGDAVGVAAPSSGVPDQYARRLDVAIEHLSDAGYEVRLGSLVRQNGIAAGSATERASELSALMQAPIVRAVVPPWGGHLALELLTKVDLGAWAKDPTWLVGYSDITALMLPLTLVTGVATLHGQNLMDTPFRVPEPMVPWLDIVQLEAGSAVVQGAATLFRGSGRQDFAADPEATEYVLDTPGGWIRLDSPDECCVSGRLVGGCLEVVSHLVGTPFGDVKTFTETHAPEGLILYLESAGSDAGDLVRRLLGLRLAGWFMNANAVLVGRSPGADLPGFSQQDAVRAALDGLGIPVLVDVDCGHIPPHLAMVNGALATVEHSPTSSRLTQMLV